MDWPGVSKGSLSTWTAIYLGIKRVDIAWNFGPPVMHKVRP